MPFLDLLRGASAIGRVGEAGYLYAASADQVDDVIERLDAAVEHHEECNVDSAYLRKQLEMLKTCWQRVKDAAENVVKEARSFAGLRG